MAYRFPSAEWVAAYKDAINKNPRYQKAGKDWTHGSVAMIVQENPAAGIPQDMGLLLDVHLGVCRNASYVLGQEAAKEAPFVIVASFDRWLEVLKKELEPIKGMMQGKLKLTKGHLPTIIRYVDASRELVESAADVPTEFPR